MQSENEELQATLSQFKNIDILRLERAVQTEEEEKSIDISEDYQSIVNERDRLIGDLNYLRKKL